MRKLLALCLAAALLLALAPLSALAAEPVADVVDVPVSAKPRPVQTVEAIAPAAAERTAPVAALQANPTVTVSSETVAVGSGTADVSLTLTFTDNPGVAGVYLTMAYDSALTLKSMERGDAIGTLTFTPPGNLAANPVKLLWDGMDADATGGLMLTVTFTVPLGEKKTYPVTLSYNPGDFYDNDMNDVDVTLVQGGITVGKAAPATTPVLTVASVDVDGGTGTRDVDVTITLADNPGVAGIYMLLHYDAALTLKELTKGPALETLEYTKPTDLSGNPLVLLWDGLEADGSNGVILTMTFTAPLGTAKTYPITLTAEPGAFYDNDMNDVDAVLIGGGVTVSEAPAHTHSWDGGVVTTPATCTEKGVKTFTCTVCRETRTEDVAATGHSFTNYVSDGNATCKDDGTKTAKCDNCDATDTVADVDSRLAVAHTSDGETDCTKNSLCTVCGATLRAAAEHTWNEGEITTAPTCTEKGVKTFACTVCAATKTEDADALGHDLVHHEAQAPTRTSVGWEAYDTCTRCDYTTYVEIPMLTVLMGDVNGDGVVNSKDTTMLRRCVAGGYTIGNFRAEAADINGDGTVNSKDTTVLRRYVAGGYNIELN